MKGFFTGVVVGFGVGLLLAPEAGSETRKKAIKTLSDVRDQIPGTAKPFIDSVTEYVEQLHASVQPVIRQADNMPDEATRLLEIFNTASKTKLMSVSGIGDATARRIVEGRPYSSADAIAGNGILSEDVLRNLKKELLETSEAA